MIKEILQEARGFIEKGWIKGVSYDGEGNYCAVGALDKACTGKDVTYHDYINLRLKLDSLVEVGIITDFNDNPKTTKEDVLAVFDKAIEEYND